MDTHGLAWAAGFFDGEGCTTVGDRSKAYPRLQVAQMNPEPLLRLKEIWGFGILREGKPPSKSNRNVYTITVSGFERVQAIIAMMWPWLTDVKRQQASRVLKRARVHRSSWRIKEGLAPAAIRTHCIDGHPFNDENTFVTRSSKRGCKECRRRRGREYWNRKHGKKMAEP